MTHDEFEERFLEKGRELYEAGDKSELLHCLDFCLMHNRPIPGWLRKAFLDAYNRVVRFREVKSWDDVFGRSAPKGWSDRRLAEWRFQASITPDIWDMVRDRHNAGEPLDDRLFASVGKHFGVGSTVVKEIYYDLAADALATEEEWMEAAINRTPLKSVSGKIKKKPEVSGKS
jgi:hypothetical protein